jgi:cell division protein FtsB
MMLAMRTRRSGRSPLRRVGRPLVSVALLAAGLVLSGAFVGIAIRQNAIDHEARTYQQQIDAELSRRAELEGQIAQRKTDQYVVDAAQDLGYVRPREGLIAVGNAPAAQTGAVITAPDTGRIARWLALFFGGR